jgi:AcrR family transcriptional regulator
MELVFSRFLKDRLRRAPPARKGERTREQLKLAAAELLAEDGYHALRLRDVTERLGLAEGTIYAHFTDRTGVINEVMREFLDNFLKLHLERGFPSAIEGVSDFEAVRRSTRQYFAVVRSNRGMFRCMLQMGDDEPAFSRQVQMFSLDVTRRITRRSDAVRSDATLTSPALLVYAMKFMLKETVRRYYIYPDPIFVDMVREMGGGDDLVADVVSMVATRILYPEAEVPADLNGPLAEIGAWFASGTCSPLSQTVNRPAEGAAI